MTGALARLGGVFLHPRTTLMSVLAGKGGSFFEVLPWIIVASLTVSPQRTGQMVLVGRVDLIDGFRALLGLVANRAGGAVFGAVGGAIVLVGIDRVRAATKHRLPFDRSLDACMYALLPFLLLACVGSALSSLGAEMWFMPHRLLRGRGVYLLLRFVVAYGWPIALFVVMAVGVWRGQVRRDDEAVG